MILLNIPYDLEVFFYLFVGLVGVYNGLKTAMNPV